MNNQIPGGSELDKCVQQKSAYIDLASHSIGIGRRKPYHRHGRTYYRPYRNYFASPSTGNDNWDVMVGAGYATRHETESGQIIYCMTREGLDWLGRQLGMTIYDEED